MIDQTRFVMKHATMFIILIIMCDADIYFLAFSVF